MFAAKAAALRTLDLSRQVGAAIFSQQGDVIAMGSNEVPSGLGGTYWADGDEDIDDRDYRREHDANDRRKSQLLNELLQLASVSNIQDLLQRAEIKESQFMDALEYGRIIHAEMSAICDAALRKILLILADRSRCGQQPIPRQTYWSSAFVIQHILASRADIACESNSVVACWSKYNPCETAFRFRVLSLNY